MKRGAFSGFDNCSVHRGQRAVDRLKTKHRRLVLVHLSTHACWLNQIEIYFSVVQRKVLTPNDLQNLDAVSDRLLSFQSYWESISRPFARRRKSVNRSEPEPPPPPLEVGEILQSVQTLLL